VQNIAMELRDPEEREFLVWLRNVERSAIVPLKWAIFATAVIFWVLNHRLNWLPPVEVFSLFTVYLMFNLGESYFLYLSRVSLSQARYLCVTSYCVDIAFVTLLVYFDNRAFPSVGAATDFYLFYFLLILRGFALFRTPQGNLAANTIIGIFFLMSVLGQDSESLGETSRGTLIRVVFVWLVITMSWFIARIISRQKDEIMRSRENLIRGESMATLGEVAAGVAHEINNPIGIISAYAEFLERNCPANDPRLEDFQIIHKEARRCENIVAELLNYARPGAPDQGPVDIRRLADDVLDFLMRRQKGPEVKVVRDYDEHLPVLPLDGNQIKQALMNLFINARQAMLQTGGVLTVSIKSQMNRNMVVLTVKDTGPGISPENLVKVFEPFYTTRKEGTGLGLAISKRIVENQGGQIRIESEPGQGTLVELLLPFDKTMME
jgi:signal transduction histidine kinase